LHPCSLKRRTLHFSEQLKALQDVFGYAGMAPEKGFNANFPEPNAEVSWREEASWWVSKPAFVLRAAGLTTSALQQA
jgi:hypothetical protein